MITPKGVCSMPEDRLSNQDALKIAHAITAETLLETAADRDSPGTHVSPDQADLDRILQWLRT